MQPNHFYTAYWSAVNLQPDHLYTAYRSAVNLLSILIITRKYVLVKYSYPYYMQYYKDFSSLIRHLPSPLIPTCLAHNCLYLLNPFSPVYPCQKKKDLPLGKSFLAKTETEGFEPSCPCRQTDFESVSLRPLRYVSVYLW